MVDKLSSRAFRVCDRAAAAAMTKPFQRHLVLSLTHRTATVSELVAESGCEMSRVHYAVRRLAELGLLKVSSEHKRAGRPVKHYKAVAEEIYVPTDLMPEHPGATLQRELSHLLESSGHRTAGILFHRATDGAMLMQPVMAEHADMQLTSDRWYIVELDKHEAIELATNIAALIKAAQDASKKKKPDHYLVRTAIVRRPEAPFFVP